MTMPHGWNISPNSTSMTGSPNSASSEQSATIKQRVISNKNYHQGQHQDMFMIMNKLYTCPSNDQSFGSNLKKCISGEKVITRRVLKYYLNI